MKSFTRAGCALLCAVHASAWSQPTPAEPSASVPRQIYQSPLTGMRPLAQAKVQPWRQTNDTVLQRGGWKAYAEEAQAPEGEAPPMVVTPQAAATPAPAGHVHGAAPVTSSGPATAAPAPGAPASSPKGSHHRHHHQMMKGKMMGGQP